MSVWNIYYLGKIVDTVVAPDTATISDIKDILGCDGMFDSRFTIIRNIAGENDEMATFDKMCDILLENIESCNREIDIAISKIKKIA